MPTPPILLPYYLADFVPNNGSFDVTLHEEHEPKVLKCTFLHHDITHVFWAAESYEFCINCSIIVCKYYIIKYNWLSDKDDMYWL